MLTGSRGLARISANPGKTQLINHFLVEDKWYLVDLPGYGYARTSKEARASWNKMITAYLSERPNLMCSFILIDIRLEMQENDAQMIRWFGLHKLSFALLFTKADKISAQQCDKQIRLYQDKLLHDWEELPPIWVTSAKTAQGRDEIIQYIREVNALFDKSVLI